MCRAGWLICIINDLRDLVGHVGPLPAVHGFFPLIRIRLSLACAHVVYLPGFCGHVHVSSGPTANAKIVIWIDGDFII